MGGATGGRARHSAIAPDRSCTIGGVRYVLLQETRLGRTILAVAVVGWLIYFFSAILGR